MVSLIDIPNYLDPLPERDSHGRKLYRFNRDVRIDITTDGRVSDVIRKNYVTNLGTIPVWLGWFFQPESLLREAPPHDWACNEDQVADGVVIQNGYSRWMADALLEELMIRNGKPWWKRRLIWLAVRSYAIWKGLK